MAIEASVTGLRAPSAEYGLDRSDLDDLETAVLQQLNPPLNLDKMAPSPLRMTLRVLRSRLGAL